MARPDTGFERRTSLILLQYWNELRGDRPFPHEDEIDPDRLAEVWGHCFLLQIRDIEEVKDYNYTYLGPKIVQAYNDGVLVPNGTMITPNANDLAALYNEVIETQDPLMDENEYTNPAGDLIKFRQSMMPLGTPDGKVLAIMGGAWYKPFVA